MPDFILTDLGNEADTQFDPTAAALLKAAGRAIAVTGAAYDSAPQLTEDATLIGGTGSKAVAAGPVATALIGSATPCVRVTVKAWVTNTATLYVGLSTVTSDNTATGGFQLSPGEAMTFGIDDLADVYIHGTAAQGASFLYET
jgi:hypothetical protein